MTRIPIQPEREAVCMSTDVHLMCVCILRTVCRLTGKAKSEKEASLVFQHCFKDAQPP